mmetsp:Transcript_23873/g.44373  ORF Transcript_23873/g.44373 Transcript_23873/m.44373 type:complete len:411 (-) Transcript_23873:469-1701(-)
MALVPRHGKNCYTASLVHKFPCCTNARFWFEGAIVILMGQMRTHYTTNSLNQCQNENNQTNCFVVTNASLLCSGLEMVWCRLRTHCSYHNAKECNRHQNSEGIQSSVKLKPKTFPGNQVTTKRIANRYGNQNSPGDACHPTVGRERSLSVVEIKRFGTTCYTTAVCSARGQSQRYNTANRMETQIIIKTSRSQKHVSSIGINWHFTRFRQQFCKGQDCVRFILFDITVKNGLLIRESDGGRGLPPEIIFARIAFTDIFIGQPDHGKRSNHRTGLADAESYPALSFIDDLSSKVALSCFFINIDHVIQCQAKSFKFMGSYELTAVHGPSLECCVFIISWCIPAISCSGSLEWNGHCILNRDDRRLARGSQFHNCSHDLSTESKLPRSSFIAFITNAHFHGQAPDQGFTFVI